jgi:Ser/Thr protein kinase RdoA (MazF antagonist)
MADATPTEPAKESPLGDGVFPVIHSLLSAEALGRFVQAEYDIGLVSSCVLLQHNLNDTYLIEATVGRYVLRVSQARRASGLSSRTREDILFELDVLAYLFERGVAVATPLWRKDGSRVSSVQAPEGTRYLVLFTYAPGDPLTPPRQTDSIAQRYGAALAALHTASEGFSCPHQRFALNLDYLLAKPLALIRPYLDKRPANLSYLSDLAAAVTERVAVLQSRGLDYGVCHGDAQGGNAHITEDGTITFFDFDVCGMGWRAYDIAVFFWGAALGHVRLGWDVQKVERLCAAYLSGYQARRPLGRVDEEAIAVCVVLRQFWYLGLEVGNWDTWGIGESQREQFFDRELRFMREWADEHRLLG